MTREADINALNEVVQLVLEEGMDGLGAAVSILLNEAMKIERSRALRARPWERTEERRGYANGYKDRTVKTRLGKLELKVPQVRGDVEFHPSALERGQRSERALKQALAQMYVQGVSTRKVTRIVETMCGTNVSASVLIAAGIDGEGRRSILGVSVSMNEAEPHWGQFLQSLKERGMHGANIKA